MFILPSFLNTDRLGGLKVHHTIIFPPRIPRRKRRTIQRSRRDTRGVKNARIVSEIITRYIRECLRAGRRERKQRRNWAAVVGCDLRLIGRIR